MSNRTRNQQDGAAGQDWVLPRGTASRDGWDVVVDDTALPDDTGWEHTGLRVLSLVPVEQATFDAAGWECVAVPLAGGFSLRVETPDGEVDVVELAGRASVFSGPTDVAYLPAGSRITVSSPAGGRLALCLARVDGEPTTRKVRRVDASEIPVELRGAGACSREVHNFGTPGVLDADAIIACEVLTPAGNWSSYPPHKHDEDRGEEEAALEEIYYFETRVEGGASGPGDADAVAYQRVYGTPERPIDVLTEVRTGDVVLVPHGWHGPSMAPPGYDLYYLNVMAGPGPQRAWLICDDPAHAWVRSSWADQAVDPRLPLTGEQA